MVRDGEGFLHRKSKTTIKKTKDSKQSNLNYMIHEDSIAFYKTRITIIEST